MPILPNINPTVPAWCNLRQALQWIQDDTVPVDTPFELAVGVDRHPYLPNYSNAIAHIYAAILHNKITIYGKPGIGNLINDYGEFGNWQGFYFSNNGDFERIPIERAIEAEIPGFDFERGSLQHVVKSCDADGSAEEAWEYWDIRLSTAALLRVFPPSKPLSIDIPPELKIEGAALANRQSKVPHQIRLSRAINLLAFGLLDDPEAPDSGVVHRKAWPMLFEALWNGGVPAMGLPWGECGSGREAQPIPATFWRMDGASWSEGTVQSGTGGYTEVMVDEAAVRALAAEPAPALTAPLTSLPIIPTAPLQPTASPPPPRYRTPMLDLIDTLRGEIETAGDWDRKPPTGPWIAKRCEELGHTGPNFSGNDLAALKALLLRPEHRGKSQKG